MTDTLMSVDDLKARIETFAASRGIACATVTSRAVGNSRLYARMQNGGGCSIRIAAKLLAYMAETPADTEAA